MSARISWVQIPPPPPFNSFTMVSALLNKKILEKNNPSCIGLDPRLEWLPEKITRKYKEKYGFSFKAASLSIIEFNRQVIDSLCHIIPAVKPQLAFYEKYGPEGLLAFYETVKYARNKGLIVIADAKRGDIGTTAEAYAEAFLGKVNVFGKSVPCFDADFMTVNPFLGEDSLTPFIDVCEKYGKGIFVLVKTSNPGSKDFQDFKAEDQTIYLKIAKILSKYAQRERRKNNYSNIGAVVGATFPDEARVLRRVMPNTVFLVPGYGPQGAKAEDLKHFFNEDGLGAIINSSRQVVFSYLDKKGGEEDYLKIIEQEAINMRNEINKKVFNR